MKTTAWLIFMFIYLTAIPVFAQISIEGPLEQDSAISSKIVSYQNVLTVRYIIANKALRLHFIEEGNKENLIEYEPYGTGFIGIGGIYKKLGLEVLVRIPIRNQINNQKHGITRSLDLQLNQYGRKFGVDLLVQRYKGFYIKNPASIYKNWDASHAFPQRSDIVAWNVGLNLYYVFNHKNFSYRASFIQTERQLKSDGSFVLMTSLFRVSQSADSSMVPKDTDVNFNQDSYLQKGNYYSVAVLPGYAHTFIAGRFYLTLSLFLGTGLQRQEFKVDATTSKSYIVTLKSNVRSAVGYNGDKVFTGISFVTDNSTFKINDLEVLTKSNNFKLFAGMRF